MEIGFFMSIVIIVISFIVLIIGILGLIMTLRERTWGNPRRDEVELYSKLIAYSLLFIVSIGGHYLFSWF